MSTLTFTMEKEVAIKMLQALEMQFEIENHLVTDSTFQTVESFRMAASMSDEDLQDDLQTRIHTLNMAIKSLLTAQSAVDQLQAVVNNA